MGMRSLKNQNQKDQKNTLETLNLNQKGPYAELLKALEVAVIDVLDNLVDAAYVVKQQSQGRSRVPIFADLQYFSQLMTRR